MPLPESACLLNLQDGTVQLCIRDAQLQMEFQVPAVQGDDIARYKALLPSLMDMHGVSATVKWTRQGAAAHLTVMLIPNDASLAHSQVLETWRTHVTLATIRRCSCISRHTLCCSSWQWRLAPMRPGATNLLQMLCKAWEFQTLYK